MDNLYSSDLDLILSKFLVQLPYNHYNTFTEAISKAEVNDKDNDAYPLMNYDQNQYDGLEDQNGKIKGKEK